jgi:hypothetical protein
MRYENRKMLARLHANRMSALSRFMYFIIEGVSLIIGEW